MYKQIMKKYIFLILFTFFAFYGKSENDVIIIDSSDTIPCFKLSEVAQSVDTVSLKIKGMGSAQNIFLSLFLNTHDPEPSSAYWIAKILHQI